MFTLRSTSSATTVCPEREYVAFIDSINRLNPDLWPADINTNSTFADDDIRQLCMRFRVPQEEAVQGFREFLDTGGHRLPDGLKSLCCAINTLVVSTADCERAFSCMNETLTATRNSLAVDTLSSLMFMSVCGPPMSAFKPEQYVTSWLCKDVSADDSQARARSTEQVTSSDMSCMWKLV